MFKLRPIPALILVSALLPACSTTVPLPKMQLTIKPHEVVRNTPGAQVDPYELGRQFQAAGKSGLAMDAYAQAIRLKKRDAEARNALAELYSKEGRFAEAERLLREVIAQGAASAYLHNNLGYVYFLQGNADAAVRELRAALALDPSHEWARNNLRLAETALERRMIANINPAAQRSETTVKAFEVWGQAQGREANTQVVQTATSSTPAEQANPPAPAAARATDLVAQALNEQAAKHHASAMPSQLQHKVRAVAGLEKLDRQLDVRIADFVATVSEKYRLEVSNGNGITGFAKRVSQILTRQGMPVHNLTNQPPYQQATTEIQYTAGFEREAEQIMNTLRGHAIVTPTSSTRNRTEVRVVLGRDIATRIAEIETERPSMVAASKSGPGQL